jgi:hypothetical protein
VWTGGFGGVQSFNGDAVVGSADAARRIQARNIVVVFKELKAPPPAYQPRTWRCLCVGWNTI